jgi:hypothetical protein
LADRVESSHRASTAGWIPLAIGLSAVVLLWDLLQLPQLLNFRAFAFNDPGSNLTINYLISHGYRPVIDFGYPYGLLGLFANLAWFRAVPLTPAGYQTASILCQLGVACALARTARALALRPLQLIFLFVAIGRAVIPTYWNFAHALEAVLISFAMAEQARGARANALALTTAAVFAKPSMGVVYSALLLTLIALNLYRCRTAGLAAWFKQIRPATIVGISLCSILGIVFGVDALYRTVVPLSGVAEYRALKWGFFNESGARFWHPEGASWHYYGGTVIGLWAVAGAYLVWGAIPAARRVWRNPATETGSAEMRRDELVLSCALLHLAFILLFFGATVSWNYYSYLLIMGAAVVPIDQAIHRSAFCAVIVIAAGTYYALVVSSISGWRSMTRSPATASLWSSAPLRDEWSGVLAASKGRRTAILHFAGAVEMLYPGFERPIGTYFLAGLMSPREIQHEVARIESADVIVIPSGILSPVSSGFLQTPQADRALAPFKEIVQGEYFSIYERPR